MIHTDKRTGSRWGWWASVLLLLGMAVGCQQEPPDPERGKKEQKKLDNLRNQENENIKKQNPKVE